MMIILNQNFKVKTIILTLTLIVLTCFCSIAQDYNSIREKLEAVSDSSLLLRKNVMKVLKKHGAKSPQMDSLNTLILRYDSTSLIQVTQVIDKYGWLGTSQVGEKANQALYLTIQHAQDILLREKYFPLLETSAKKGESSLTDMATMKDRILIESGQEQLYGTQYKVVDGKRVLLPIRDSDKVNKRRSKVGLDKLILP